MPVITSRQHSVVKAFRTAARGDAAMALVDGWHLLAEAERADLAIETVAVAGEPPDGTTANLLRALGRRARVISVSGDVMKAISPVRTPSGVAALVGKRPSTLGALLSHDPALVLVAVDVQDPGNAGAIVRAAEAGGSDGVVFCGEAADPWGWKALRASMGSTFRLAVAREADAAAVCRTLRGAGLALVATVPRGGAPMQEADLRRRMALLVGGEGEGLAPALIDAADLRVSIPMAAGVESLNVAVAAALLVYESRRQRHSHAAALAAGRDRES
jgi:TrmH family RNA methyltransferase